MDIVLQLRKSANTVYKQDGYTFRLGLQNEAADEIDKLREDRERLQYALMKVCNSLDDNLPAIITKNIALAALGLPLRGMKEGE